MKIALIGTHGTGKTTLAHELVAQLKKMGRNAEFLGEIARMCPLPINEELTKNSAEWIIYSQHIKEMELEPKCEMLVCDRSVFDGYVYYNHRFGDDKMLEDFVREKIKWYDLLFRIPMNNGYLKYDGKRSTNPQFQKEIDSKFDKLLGKFSIKHHIARNVNEILREIMA